jgi:ribose 5-phosphate isomerase A
MVEMASKLFVCIVDETKLVAGLGASGDAMPVEVVQFCAEYTRARLAALPELAGAEARLRTNADGSLYVTDNSNYIVDLYFAKGAFIPDAQAAARALIDIEGVVEHGLFMDMVDVCIIAGSAGVEVKARK